MTLRPPYYNIMAYISNKIMDMKARVLLTIVFAFFAIQLMGCTTDSKITSDGFYDKRSQHNAEEKLALAAESVSKSLAELAEIERTIHPQKRMPSPVDPNMIGMAQLVSIDWSGPVEPLARKIARAAKYKLKTLGTRPGIPVLVSISAKDTPLADVLRDANFQCGRKAKIVVYPASKVIELRYVK